MNAQHYTSQPAKGNSEEPSRANDTQWSRVDGCPVDAYTEAEQAARSVMHPEHYDADWRYYYGAMGG